MFLYPDCLVKAIFRKKVTAQEKNIPEDGNL